jgi:hypothetical protein
LKRLLVLSVLVCAAAIVVPSALAYGDTAQYQVGMSLNCDNPAFQLCAPPPAGVGLGGFWGWWEFDQGGTGDAQLAECGHTTAGGGPGTAGAGHIDMDILRWSIGPSNPTDPTFPLPDFYVDLANMTFTGAGTTPTSVQGIPFGDTMVPAVPGHYDIHYAPGVTAQIQVALIPNR